jgi:hypothetical protein
MFFMPQSKVASYFVYSATIPYVCLSLPHPLSIFSLQKFIYLLHPLEWHLNP